MAKTAFTATQVSVGGGQVTIDGNDKITCEDGTYGDPAPNAFNLPHISTCPGSTPSCRSSCYVHGLQTHAPDVYRTYMDNERVLHQILSTEQRMRTSAFSLAAWIADNCTRFRWHVSGDLMSAAHLRWIYQVCELSSGVKHWIYTRSFDVLLAHPARPANLEINVSADRDNWMRAKAVAKTLRLRLCYMSQGEGDVPSLPRGSVIFPDYPARGRELADPTEHAWWQELTQAQRRMVCPADFFGQSEQHRCGPCRKCMIK